jgi:ABC-type transporter Mla subunit MlaD
VVRLPFRRVWLVVAPSIALAVCAGGYTAWKANRPRLQVKTCFHESTNLARGAKVRIGGVEVGEVRRVTPEVSQCPVGIDFEVYLTKELRYLPSNATVQRETEGLLGPQYLAIELPAVSGPAIGNHGELKAVEYKVGLDPKTAEKLKRFVNDEIDKMTVRPEDTNPSTQGAAK